MTAHIRPQATAPVTLEQAVALVDEASGAGSDAIEALESATHALQAVVARLRRAQAARAELAARVPIADAAAGPASPCGGTAAR